MLRDEDVPLFDSSHGDFGKVREYGLGRSPASNTGAVIPQVVELTAKTLDELNLSEELLENYKAARHVRELTKTDQDCPVNQKAQIINSMSSILAQMTALKTKLYDAERVKLLENTLIEVLKEFPEIQDAFLTKYRERLSELS